MKKIAVIFLLLLAVQGAVGQLRFYTSTADLKTISEDDAPVRCAFRYVNESDKPIVIVRVETSCGCTKPEFSAAPILPGQGGEVAVTFYPKGQAGVLHRAIYLRTSASQTPTQLTLQGVVTPTKDKYVQYPFRMGALRLKQNTVRFGLVRKPMRTMARIEVVNGGTRPLRLALPAAPAWLSFRTEPEVIAPDSVGDLIFVCDPRNLESGVVQTEVILGGIVAPPSERMVQLSVEIR